MGFGDYNIDTTYSIDGLGGEVLVDQRKHLQPKINEVQTLKEEKKEILVDQNLDAETIEQYFIRTETPTQT